jgi:hypothetical protein
LEGDVISFRPKIAEKILLKERTNRIVYFYKGDEKEMEQFS